MPDFRFSKENVTTPITHAFLVTPHDTNELTNRALDNF